jgi:hypothetical protein
LLSLARLSAVLLSAVLLSAAVVLSALLSGREKRSANEEQPAKSRRLPPSAASSAHILFFI